MVRLAFLCSFLLVGCDDSSPAPLPVSTVPSSSASQQRNDGSLAEAQTKLARLEARRAEIQRLVDRTSNERDRLVAHLHELGVKSSADLKGNPQAVSYAESLQRTALELQSLQRDAARFDMAIHHTNELIRRLERSSALEGFDDDLATLAEQVMELDESLGDAAPLDPIQEAAILDQELQRQAASTTGGVGTPGIVGNWEHKHPTDGHTYSLEFTAGSTVILNRYSLQKVGKYVLDGSGLILTDDNGRQVRYSLDFISPREVIFRNESHDYGGFNGLAGRWFAR